ncbi:MAG: orotate phosphoribosyltransferase [Lysobacterales bacterium GWF1_69_6]|nr:MAG: orotate phosphoribosyltransferase [Xanthomonadales bacterium GWF1_69_6]
MNEITQEQKTWGMISHLSSLVGFIIPLGNVLGPLVVWLIKKDTMPFVDDQAKEALNFNITVLIAAIVSGILTVILIGFLLLLVVGLGWLVLTVMAAIKANEGVSYRYPFTLRLIK